MRSTDRPLPSTTRRHVARRLVGEARRSADRASAIQSELDAAASTAATTTSRSSSPNSRAISSLRSASLPPRSEEHTSELQSLMRISYAVFCLKKKTNNVNTSTTPTKLYYQKQ